MKQWIPEYETLSHLDEYSLGLVTNRLKDFLKDYGPLTWPLNCLELILDVQAKHMICLDIRKSSSLPPGLDGRTTYDPVTKYYLMELRPDPPDWFARSAARRCNFTAAHELGHIILDHAKIPDDIKPDSLKQREEAEANEFASRLLMPEELILSACFSSRAEMAAAFLVSEQALFHRLNNLRRLDRLSLPPAVCPSCGSRRISPCASWCRMCGASLGRNIPEKTAMMLRLPRSPRCPVCGSDIAGTDYGDCPDCGYPRSNPCTAEYDQPRHPNPPDARFCETCGAETLYAELARTPQITRDMPLYRTFRNLP